MVQRTFLTLATLTLPVLVLAQAEAPVPPPAAQTPVSVPAATTPSTSSIPTIPAGATDDREAMAKERGAARKAIMDKMRECMKSAVTKEEKKVCRDAMRKSRAELREPKRGNAERKKK